MNEYSAAAARAANCWFETDRVSGDAVTTGWRRRARFRQACWREERGYPIGFNPYRGGPQAAAVGSRLELDFARASGANFLSPAIVAAVRSRLANPEQYQTLNEERLWADLLSSMPLCFNLFGELVEDAIAAARAVRAWWPDAPSGSVDVRFEHSPGRCDPEFLGNKSAFDVAFTINTPDGTSAIVGIETKYHEHAAVERPPKSVALRRYAEVTERSGIFVPHWRDLVLGTDLQQIWLDHLLLLSMIQHRSRRWRWGRFVLAYPRENPSFNSAANRYREVLLRTDSYAPVCIDVLASISNELGHRTATAFIARYLDRSLQS